MGNEVLLVSGANPGEMPGAMSARFVPFRVTDPERRALCNRDAKVYQESLAIEVEHLGNIIREFRPHIVHAFGLAFEAEACLHTGFKPFVVSSWGYLESFFKTGILEPKYAVILKNASVILEPPALEERLRIVLPTGHPIYTYHHGVDERIFHRGYATEAARWRSVLALPPQARLVLSARGWGETYRHRAVLRAFAKMQPNFPIPAILVFLRLGRSYDSQIIRQEYEIIGQMARQLGVSEFIRWLPPPPAFMLAPLYNAADAIVSWRIPDTFPATVLEALACQRPVLAPDLPIFKSTPVAECTYLVSPPDDDHLADALLDVLLYPPEMTLLATRREIVLKDYAASVTRFRLMEIYEDVLKNERG